MAIGKAKDSEPVKNNAGTVKCKGNLTLGGVVNSNLPFDQTITGPHFGATFLANRDLINQEIGNPNNEHYRNQLTDYSAKPNNIDYMTGRPDSYTESVNSFTMSSGNPENNINSFYYFIGEPQKFSPEPDSTITPSVEVYLAALLNSTYSAEDGFNYVTTPILDGKRALSIFSGPVSYTNEFHEKNFILYLASGVVPAIVSQSNYTLDGWKKLNLNLPGWVTEITAVTYDDLGESFSIGVGSGLSQATTQTRSVAFGATTRTNPMTYQGGTNLTLVSGEKAVRVPCTSGALQLTILEIDNQGTKSKPVYYIVPNGSTATYYPVYNQISIAENQGKAFNVQVLS